MPTTLSPEQQQAVQMQGDRPVEVIDPRTSRVYLLIARDQYDRLKPLFEAEPLSEQEQRALLIQAGNRAGWDEPAMDAYDHYDERTGKQP